MLPSLILVSWKENHIFAVRKQRMCVGFCLLSNPRKLLYFARVGRGGGCVRGAGILAHEDKVCHKFLFDIIVKTVRGCTQTFPRPWVVIDFGLSIDVFFKTITYKMERRTRH
jgi:hypothetical protein